LANRKKSAIGTGVNEQPIGLVIPTDRKCLDQIKNKRIIYSKLKDVTLMRQDTT